MPALCEHHPLRASRRRGLGSRRIVVAPRHELDAQLVPMVACSNCLAIDPPSCMAGCENGYMPAEPPNMSFLRHGDYVQYADQPPAFARGGRGVAACMLVVGGGVVFVEVTDADGSDRRSVDVALLRSPWP